VPGDGGTDDRHALPLLLRVQVALRFTFFGYTRGC
jgi:hypothetical protein